MQLRGFKHIIQKALINTLHLAVSLSAPWGHLMRAALCVYLCFSVLALSPEISQNKRFRETQDRTLEHWSLRVPWFCGLWNSTSSPQHCSLVVTKAGESPLSNMHSVIYCCSGHFLVSFIPHKRCTISLCPQVFGSGFKTRQSAGCIWLNQLELKQNPSLEDIVTHLTLGPGWMKDWAPLEALTEGLHSPVYVASCRIFSFCQSASLYYCVNAGQCVNAILS